MDFLIRSEWKERGAAPTVLGMLVFHVPSAAVLCFDLLGSILAIAISDLSHRDWTPFFAAAGLVGFVCRKLAYPEFTQDELNAPEPPLSLFPK